MGLKRALLNHQLAGDDQFLYVVGFLKYTSAPHCAKDALHGKVLQMAVIAKGLNRIGTDPSAISVANNFAMEASLRHFRKPMKPMGSTIEFAW